jgi:hypothetical protein
LYKKKDDRSKVKAKTLASYVSLRIVLPRPSVSRNRTCKGVDDDDDDDDTRVLP